MQYYISTDKPFPLFCYNDFMEQKVYVFDPTVKDSQSQMRGIGRYLQTLKENFSQEELVFTADVKSIPRQSVLINPFLNLLQPLPFFSRLAQTQIGVIHDLIPLKYPRHFPIGLWASTKLFFRKWTLRHYDLFVTDSQASKNDLIKILRIPEKKIQVIYPAFSQRFLPHLTYPPDENSRLMFQKTADSQEHPQYSPFASEQFVDNPQIKSLTNFVLYVGDGSWNKNLPTLARALKIANVPVVLVGKVFENAEPHKLTHPWQKDLQLFFKEIQGDAKFTLLGYVTDVELKYLYKTARINLLVSRDEGFGYSFVEAGMCSTPSVLADIPVFREIGQEGALYAKPEDPLDIAKKIVELYFNPQNRELYSVRAFERAQDFSPKAFRESWLKTIKTLV